MESCTCKSTSLTKKNTLNQLKEATLWEIMGNYIFKICLGAGSRQYCRYTKSPLGITPLKEIWESSRVKENLTSVGFEPTTSGLDLPMLYRLSHEASAGAGRGNLGSESWLMFI